MNIKLLNILKELFSNDVIEYNKDDFCYLKNGYDELIWYLDKEEESFIDISYLEDIIDNDKIESEYFEIHFSECYSTKEGKCWKIINYSNDNIIATIYDEEIKNKVFNVIKKACQNVLEEHNNNLIKERMKEELLEEFENLDEEQAKKLYEFLKGLR